MRCIISMNIPILTIYIWVKTFKAYYEKSTIVYRATNIINSGLVNLELLFLCHNSSERRPKSGHMALRYAEGEGWG